MTEKNESSKFDWDQANFSKGDSSNWWVKGAIHQVQDLQMEQLKVTAPNKSKEMGSRDYFDGTLKGKAGELLIVGNGEEGFAVPGSVMSVEKGGLGRAGDASITIANDGSKVDTFAGRELVLAKPGSKVHARESTVVLAEPGSQVYLESGAAVRAQTGADVLAEGPNRSVETIPGMHTTVDGKTFGVPSYAETDMKNRLRVVHAKPGSELVATNVDVVAEPGSRVVAGDGARVLAEKGSVVDASGESLVIKESGAEVQARDGAKVVDGQRTLDQSKDSYIYFKNDGSLFYDVVNAGSVIASQNSRLESYNTDVTAENGSTVKSRSGNIIAKSGSTVDAYIPSTVIAESGSHVTVDGSGRVIAEGGSIVKDTGSKVEAQSGSIVEVGKLSIVEAQAGSNVTANDGATVVAKAGSKVEAGAGVVVEAKAGSTVHAKHLSKVHAERGAHVTYDDDWMTRSGRALLDYLAKEFPLTQ